MKCKICELPVSSSCIFCKPEEAYAFQDKFEGLTEEPVVDEEDQELIDSFVHQGRTAPKFYE